MCSSTNCIKLSSVIICLEVVVSLLVLLTRRLLWSTIRESEIAIFDICHTFCAHVLYTMWQSRVLIHGEK